MKNKKSILIVILVFVLLLGGASVLYGKLSQEVASDQLAAQGEAQPQEGSETGESETEHMLAPDFTVYDREGGEVRLSDYIGKPVVVNFWASWCGPCQSEMPDFNEAYAELGEDIHFLMVNMTDGSRETVEKASRFIEESGYAFPVLYDTQSNAATTYGVYSIPTTYFIDAEGHAIAQATGAIDRATLEKGIGMITEE